VAALSTTNRCARIIGAHAGLEIESSIAANRARGNGNHLDYFFPSHGARASQLAVSSFQSNFRISSYLASIFLSFVRPAASTSVVI
jgi:hypothetical protein